MELVMCKAHEGQKRKTQLQSPDLHPSPPHPPLKPYPLSSLSSPLLPLQPQQILLYRGGGSPLVVIMKHCFSLVDHLISRGLFSPAQLAIQRIISRCSTVPNAISAVDFAIVRGMELDSCSYSALVRTLVGSGEAELAEVLYIENVVRRGNYVSPSLLNSMVICYFKLGKLEEAKSHFDRLIEMNYVPCKGACKSLLCEFCIQNRFLEALDYFIRINDAGVVLGFWCYNMLTDGLCFRGYLEEALCVLDVMHERGVSLNFNSFKSLVLGFCTRGWVEEAEMLSVEMESHDFVLNKVLHTSIIHEYCKQKKLKMAMREAGGGKKEKGKKMG